MNHRDAVLAFDVGGTSIKAEALGPDTSTWARVDAPTPRGPAVIDAIASVARRLLAALSPAQRDRVAGLGVALPGIVDSARGVSLFAANVGLREVEIAAPLAELVGLPVRLGHDVTVAGEAERVRGAARDLDDPVIVVIGTGIAAVSYVHGRLVRGVSGQAGELGHVVVRPGGPRCGCGARGCLESIASAGAIARSYTQTSGRSVDGAADVLARLGRDEAADAVWREATSALADGLLLVAALLAPGGIVLGGGLAQAGTALTEPVSALMAARATAVSVPPLRTALLGSRAGVVGAGLLLLPGRDGGEAA